MAHQGELMDVLAQAISCEYPNTNGAVNLNRLRELLTRLISWKAQCVKSHSSRNSLEPRQTLHTFETKTSTSSSTALAKNASKQDHESNNEQDCCLTDENNFRFVAHTPSLPDQHRSPETCVDVCQKIKELQQQVTNVEVRLHEIEVMDLETIVQRLIQKEENVLKLNSPSNAKLNSGETCTNNLIHDETIANCGPSPNNVQAQQGRSSNGSIMMAEGKKSSEQSLLQEKVLVQGRTNAIPRREISETSSIVTTLPAQTQTVPFMSSNELAYEEAVNCGKEQLVLSGENRQHPESSAEEQHAARKFIELDMIVAAMTKRENELLERQTQLERMLTEYVEKLHNLLQTKNSSTVTTDTGNELDDKPDFPAPKSHHENFAEKLDVETFTCFATEVRLALSELRERILSVEALIGEPHAAGGKLPLQLPHRVKCISCDGHAVMKRFSEHATDPMLFSTNRCLKPFLTTQLTLLQKKRKPLGWPW